MCMFMVLCVYVCVDLFVNLMLLRSYAVAQAAQIDGICDALGACEVRRADALESPMCLFMV